MEKEEIAEYDIARSRLAMLVESPMIYQYTELRLIVRKSQTDDYINVMLDCDNGDARYILYTQRGRDAIHRCITCAEFILKAFGEKLD